jgi:hypothetical protein
MKGRTGLTGVRKCRFVRRWKALASLGRSGGSSTCVGTISVRLITTRARRKRLWARSDSEAIGAVLYIGAIRAVLSHLLVHTPSHVRPTRAPPRLRESVGCIALTLHRSTAAMTIVL